MKTLKKFEFSTFGGRESSYDWATILDGSIRQLEHGAGKDFDCKPLTFLSLARAAARKRGKTLKTATVEGGVVVQAEEATEEQKASWAAADEANKAKASERRAAKKAEESATPATTETPA